LSGSYNHPWAGGVMTVMSQYFAGVEPTDVAWKTYQVQPRLGKLNSIDAKVPTPKGMLSVSIRRTGEKISLKVDAPAGTTGKIVLPGKTFEAAAGVSQFESP
jgi:hypothetical protein